MKKSLNAFGIALLLGLCVFAAAYTPPAPAVGGCSPGGPYYDTSKTFPIFYGKLDTVVTTGTDTFKMSLACKPVSITFSNSVLKTFGSPTVTVTLYGSADGGITYASLTSYSAVPTSTVTPVVNQYIVNSPSGGNPYTNYMWVASGTASSTMSWLGTVLIR